MYFMILLHTMEEFKNKVTSTDCSYTVNNTGTVISKSDQAVELGGQRHPKDNHVYVHNK